MDKSVRTAIGAKLQTAQKLKLPYEFEPNSVMNAQLGILPNETPAETPWCQYVAIGIGGMAVNLVDNNRRVEFQPIPHDPRHTGMYDQIPFVVRPVTDDLEVSERARFRLRRVREINGILYAEYFLRKMDFTDTVVNLEYRQIIDGQVKSDVWHPTADDQYPKAPRVNPGQVLVTGDDYVASSAKNTFRFSSWDMQELLNVGRVLFKSEAAITLTELAICSGVDYQTRYDFNGMSLPFIESIGTQITDFVSTLIPVQFQQSGASVNLDIGSTEPLLAIKNSASANGTVVVNGN